MYGDGKIDFAEYPTILWDKKMDTDPSYMEMMVQHISDYMLLRSSTPYANQRKEGLLFDVFDGKVTNREVEKLYNEVLNTYGAKGSSVLKDYHFFHKNYQSTKGMLLRMPFRLGAHNISQSVVDERIDKGAKMMGAMLRNRAAKQLTQEDGQDFSFMENTEQYVPSTVEKLLSEMNAPQQEEYVLTRLLLNLNRRHNISDQFAASNRDHFVAGYQFFHITDEDGEPVIKHLEKKNLTYISPVPVYDMDDPNIMSWSINGWISMENALRKYGQDLAAAPGVNTLKDIVNKLRSGEPLKSRYNPYRYQVNSASYGFGNTDPVVIDGLIQLDAAGENAQPFFYNVQDNGMFGRNCSILEQKIYFKVIRQMRFKLLIGSKNPTKEQYSTWKKDRKKLDGKIRYVAVEDDYKAKRGEVVVEAPKEELWEADRLGHCTILNIRKYRYQTRYEREMNRVKPPIVGMISKEKSFVELGLELSIFYNAFMLKAAELRNIAGADDILLIDKAQMSMTQKAAMLHSAQQTGTAEFDSTQVQDKANGMAAKHLTKTQLTPKVQTILLYLEAARIIESSFDSLVGRLGDPSPYDSAEKVNQMLQQTSLMTQNFFREDHLVRERAVQRWGDIVKMHYGSNTDRYVSVFWKGDEKEILKVTKDLSAFDYEFYLKTGIEAVEDRNFIMAQAQNAMSAGSLGFMDFIKIYYTENIQEAVATIQAAMNALKEDAAQAQAQQAEVAQAQVAVQQEKNQIPLAVKEMDVQATKYVADLRYQSQTDSLRHKEDKEDISAANRREEKMLDAEIGNQQQNTKQQGDVDRLILEKGLPDKNTVKSKG